MLSFEEKLAIIGSFPELQRRDVSMGRVNFHFEESVRDKKTIVFHLHPGGNGFVYAGLLHGYETDEKGFVNIREFSEEELRGLIGESIRSLSIKVPEATAGSGRKKARRGQGQGQGGRWLGPNNQSLDLKLEDDLWYVYAGLSLEMVFETYEEAEEYLREEGFSP